MTPDRSPIEPAHRMMIDLHDSLVAIYRVIREKYQQQIDAKFNEVARQIGFVVTTTVPVDVTVDKNGKLAGATVAAENLKGTLFEGIVSAVGKDALGANVAPGTYRVYLLWYPALKLRLRTDFIEPAHLGPGVREPAHFVPGVREPAHFGPAVREPAHFGPGVREPAHWFDAGFAIAPEEAVVIHAIDEVYPELRLADRVSSARQVGRGLGPGVREPAHAGPELREREIRVQAQVRPEVREPAHFQNPDFLRDLAAVLKKYGY